MKLFIKRFALVLATVATTSFVFWAGWDSHDMFTQAYVCEEE